MSFRANCVFCNITHYHDRDAKIWYVDNDIMVIRNRLTWVPVMLLVMPKQHLDQFDMWSNGLMSRLGTSRWNWVRPFPRRIPHFVQFRA